MSYKIGEAIYAILCTALISGILMLFREDFKAVFMKIKMKAMPENL